MPIPALLALAAIVVAGAVAAFTFLDLIIAAAIAAVGLTLVGVAALVRDWEAHPTFEQRELDRARRRTVRYEQNAGARARDRAIWDAHQAKKASADHTPG